MEILSDVKKNKLLANLPENLINELVQNSFVEKFKPGDTILREGEKGDKVCLLLKGNVKILKLADSTGRILFEMSEGDFFGEMALIDLHPRSASVVALTDCEVLSIPANYFDKLLHQYPQILINIAKELSERIRVSNEKLLNDFLNYEKEMTEQVNKLNYLIEITKRVNSTIQLDELLKIILEIALEITNADRGTVYLVDELTGEIWSKVLQGDELTEIRLPLGKGIAGYVAQTGETINLIDAYQDPRFNPEVDRKTGYRTKTMLCHPIKDKNNKVVGVFQLINKKDGIFTKKDEEMLDALSIHASIAIQNAKMAQELVNNERLAVIGRMASSIIHDIKNPMTTIKAYAQVLRKKIGEGEAIQLVDEVIRQIDRLVNMAQEILDFSRGVTSLNFSKIKLGDFLDGVIAFLARDFERNKIEIEKNLEFDDEVEMDVDKMTRVVFNIAHNSRDAMPEGGKFIIKTWREDNFFFMQFTDTGKGMPEEVKKKIFEPFVTYGKKHGTGLGMAITKKIVTEHKGDIFVESELGKGTTITIKLPLTQT
ncbi:cyclic nucleotide-binding domain-containing protein [Candidatus Chrysopegis kryptomonas]|uniref:histidine kinase n=1 Tax=Candidatus Chryseopegocella kryptomonas TaxID=1633643 RepID=A0A0P1MNV1_9BACT|nr:cyclic nucleotide-binding domain-containing protein [Candidatus Chrysopegis kryptomonas]CUS97273.1 Signal transduction histidine kinase [Candidatus Chrysopegis kryptomonas]